MKFLYLLFFIWGFSRTLTAQYFYIPDGDISVVNPTSQGDLQLSLAIPFQNRNNVQVAFSPFNSLSISAAYFRHKQTKGRDLARPSITKGSSLTAAIGLYRYINVLDKHRFFLTKGMKGLLLNANLGYSLANSNNLLNGRYQVDLSHQNIFFRSGITLDYGFMEFNWSTRFLTLDFQKAVLIGNFNDINWFRTRIRDDVENRDPRSLKETVLKISYKRRIFELFGMYNTIRNKNSRSLRFAYFEKQYYTLGILFKLHQF